MGYSILRYRETPFFYTRASLPSRYQKGIRLIFLKRAVHFVVTLQSELGDVGMDSWKSYLFFLTDYRLEIGLSRAKAYMSGRASHSMRCQVRS
jgi:hypothetical protein